MPIASPRWRAAHLPDRRRPDPRPALLRAAEAAGAWMESGISDVPDALQALAVAALVLRRTGGFRDRPAAALGRLVRALRPR